ncbi:FecR domain-containing protein [Candidatus Amesbacteria bacterium]|nr:FecR domain-containing protein [Candidatus Amesbacteria bacterium]
MYKVEEQTEESINISPNDPDVSFKHIGWLAGLIVVPLIVIGIAVPFVPKQKKPTYKINTNTVASLPSPAPEVYIATAVLASATGDVQVQRNQIWSKANGEEKVSKDDVVKTGDNSNATILFGSGSLIRVDANSQIALTDYAKDGESWIIKINQIVGRTWNRVQKLVGSSVYEVNTPTAVATVRGTAFGVDADPTKSAFTVDEGTVSAKLVDTKSPERKIISEIKIEKHQQAEVTLQKVEEIKLAIAEKRPVAEIVRVRPTEKLPEWIEEHKREIIREAPKIEKLKIEMSESAKPRFDIPDATSSRPSGTSIGTREPTPTPYTKIEQKTENKIEEKIEERIELRPTPTPFLKVEKKVELRPTPTPTSSTSPAIKIDTESFNR